MNMALDKLTATVSPEYLTTIRYAKLGWACGFTPTGHKDIVDNRGVKHFSNDLNALLAWRQEYVGPCNVMGTPPEGIAVLDFDVYKLDGPARTKAEGAILEFIQGTRASAMRSARGGIHVLVRDDPALNNATLRALAHGCPGEVKRHGGGYVVLTGSTFDGKRYREIKGHEVDGRPAPPVPSNVLRPTEVERPKAIDMEPSISPLPNMQELAELLKRIPADDYEVWCKVGMVLQVEYPVQGLRVWDWWSKRAPEKYEAGACEAKWATFHPEGKGDIVRIGTLLRLAGGHARPSVEEDFGPQGWFASHCAAGLLASDPPAYDWVLHHALLRGKVAMLAGSGGTGKSYLTYRIALYYALGRACVLGDLESSFFDPPRHAHTGRVLVLSAEDDLDDLQRRMHALADALEISAEEREKLKGRLAMVPCGLMPTRILDDKGNMTAFAKRIVAECEAAGPVDLIVLDPSISFSGDDINSAGEVAAYMRALGRIAHRVNAGVLVVTHKRKLGVGQKADPNVDDVLGSVAFTFAARSIFLYTAMDASLSSAWGITVNEASRYAGLTVHKNNHAAWDKSVIHWFERNTRGVPMPPTIPLLPVADIKQARKAAKAKDTAEYAEAVREVRGERTRIDVLRNVQEKPCMSHDNRAVELGRARRTIVSTLSYLCEAKLISIAKPATSRDPVTYTLTKEGLKSL